MGDDDWDEILDDDWGEEAAWSSSPRSSGAADAPTERPVLVLCCPAPGCGSLDVRPAHRRPDRGTTTWECRACQHRWPLPLSKGRLRAYLADDGPG